MGFIHYLPSFILIVMMITLFVMLIYIASNPSKTSLHYVFIAVIVELICWEAAVLVGGFFRGNPRMFVFVDNFTYLGAAFVPVTLLALGLAYQRGFTGFKPAHLLLLVPPIITMILIFTNDYHHLFYESYSSETGYVLGPYFYVYAAFSYVCMIVGMVMLCYSAIKTSGLLSMQAIVVFIGSIIPAVANLCYTLKVPGFDVYATPIAFSITALLFVFAIFRLGLFKVVPVATRTVVNKISDCFVVVDGKTGILDYNRAFSERFLKGTSVGERMQLSTVLSKDTGLTPGQVASIGTRVVTALADGQNTTENLNVVEPIEVPAKGQPADPSPENQKTTYYTVEYTPLIERGQPAAVILLFKDITQHVLDMKALKDNQDILLERERLASLGQMIGGIAHNLKSPILAVSGSIEQLQCLVEEYRDSIDDPEVTHDDHREIARDMDGWLGKMKTQLSYMSDIISTVKGQAAQFSEENNQPFTVNEVLKRVNILMQHSLTKDNCNLQVNVVIDPEEVIDGDINSFVQVIDNVIDNAIQAYGGKGGPIRLSVEKVGSDCRVSIADDGEPIDPETQRLLFKQMTTTKGKFGTGLGLYMSYSTVKGMFRGNMWFRSVPGGETVFYIQVPLAA